MTLDRDTAKERIQGILEQEGYREAMAIPDFKLPESLTELIASLVDAFEELSLTSPILYWMTILGLGALTVVLTVHSILGIMHLRRGEAPLAQGPERATPGDIVFDLSKAAEEAESQGRWMDALRGRFGIFILLYRRHHPGIFPLGATNREVAQALKEDPALSSPIQRVQMALDVGWYGGKSLGEKAYQDLSLDLEALHRGI